ncbi:MAG: AraC family ligand binding domain-containing protein [Verrucomicrobia bacterium]|nr:AraC family ligand binding domain-containing protein [Verrucomicrobiota bacterium]
MSKTIWLALAAVGALGFFGSGCGTGRPASAPASSVTAAHAIFTNFTDLKWEKVWPELGADGPELCMLHVDPQTGATKFMLRAPKAVHIRKHWHSTAETHSVLAGANVFACGAERVEQGPGSFNRLPARVAHEAWLPAGSLMFITLDGAWDVNWVEGAPTKDDLGR